MLPGGPAGQFVRLHLVALLRGQKLLDLFVRRFANLFDLCVLLAGGERGVALHGGDLRFHVLVDFLDLGFLVVGKVELSQFVILTLAAVPVSCLLTGIALWRRRGVLGANGGGDAAQNQKTCGDCELL